MNAALIKCLILPIIISILLSGCGGKSQEVTKKPDPRTDSLSDSLKVKNDSKTYVISGIGMRGSNKVAIINDEVVIPGMKIGKGMILKDLQPTYAIILVGDTEYYLRPASIQTALDQQKN